MVFYICGSCGYEYRPDLGDLENGIEENTDFEDLPKDWGCPVCGAGKEVFWEELSDSDEEEY